MLLGVDSKLQSGLLALTAATALASGASWAQTAPASTTAASGTEGGTELETVVVTSTRLQNAGFDAPTPTQVLSSEALAQVAQPNLFDAVIQLPALQGSTGTTYETGSTSTGLQGLSTLSLRGFSPLRTLTLFDGQRVVGANINQTVDVSLLPQMLVERVDVVTGGASASWGSDAVAGVVNFVTNKKFNGFKSDLSYGLSNYGDNGTATAKVAAGLPFADGKGHFEVAGEYTKDTGVVNEGNPELHTGCGAPGGRSWDTCSNTLGWGSAGATPAGQPNYFWGPVVLGTTSTLNGLITAGPLTGQAFAPNGTLYQYNYAAGGVPTAATLALKSGNGAITGTNGGICVGTSGCLATAAQPGDTSDHLQPATLVSPITRDTVFARLSFDITPTTEVFATFNYGHTITHTFPAGSTSLSSVSVPCNYAFFSAAITTQCEHFYFNTAGAGGTPAAGTVNNSNATYPVGFLPLGVSPVSGAYQDVDIDRYQRRFVLGGDGSFELFHRNWTWDAYGEWGANWSSLYIFDMPLKPAYTAGIDALVPAAGGAPVCGVTSQNSVGVVGANGQYATAPGNANAVLPGCVPYNFFGGIAGNSHAALNYAMPAGGLIGPYDIQDQVQVAGGLNINVKPVTLWAGDLSTAFGVDYRLENYHAYADPWGNGTNLEADGKTAIIAGQPTNPFTATYPYFSALTPTQIAVGSGVWNAGNYHIGNGQYWVEEAFLETGIPIYKIPGWGSLDGDLAGRFEHYSTAGNYFTWKLGVVWETPLPGVRIRALESADLRAPNLSEAFAPVTTINQGGTNPFNGQQFNAAILNSGNPALLPETSKTQQVGVVFQPTFIRGFQASLDYYRIAVSNIIGTTSSFQQILTNCHDGLETYCQQNYITTSNGVNLDAALPGGARGSGCTQPTCNVTTVNVPLGNLASATTQGIDLEMSYQWKLTQWGVPGTFGVHALVNHVYGFIACPNQPNTVCTDYAGALGYFSTSTSYSAAGGTIPTWKTDITEQYADTWGSLFLSQRWFNAGTFGNNFVVCQPGSCPATTALQYSEYPTVNYNHMPGAIYWDAGVTLDFWGSKLEAYAKINNIANLAPPPSGSFPGTQAGGVNNTLYDAIGRMYYAGFRVRL
jgi:outer membrane receptor protein involved in Fe transport